MYNNDRKSAEQLALVAAVVTIIISRKLTPDQMGLVGDFLEVLGDMLDVMQAQMEYNKQIREKFKKSCKRKRKTSPND
ncbi:conserved hypothetical protein [Clostridium botulinum C str. Eklund]|nr:conserved hypothetical protein [Clostridium botulinum C str. Eklund]NEZ49075.1 hypothetical protein [Clostridium botulinum]